jgi:hypothetical protein
MTRRLADLSERELAPLFNMTIPQIRRYRNSYRNRSQSPFADALPEDRKAERQRYEEWLWNLSVEEFRALRESNDPRLMLPIILRDVPFAVAGRFRALQHLLMFQGEFETRFPAAFEILFPQAAHRRERGGLHLPSFEVRVLNNWIYPHVMEQYSFGGADAHTSVSRWWQKDWRLREVNRHIAVPGLDDLQGVLLAILSREEDGERVGHSSSLYLSGDVEGVQEPGEMPIRLTDLRLADILRPDALKRGIEPVLDLLHRPCSPEHVVLWKLHVLGSELESGIQQPDVVVKYLTKIPSNEMPEDASAYVREVREQHEPDGEFLRRVEPLSQPVRAKLDLLDRQFGDAETGVAAVSFAAAALWLFLDLDTPGVETASSYRLAEHIESLASVISSLTRRLRRSTKELDQLTANRSSGALSNLPGNNHLALQQYRLGRFNLRQAAEWLGITPYSSKTGKGTRDWKARVKKRLRAGKQFEDENYPRAAAIFANRDHPWVRRKARRAYRGYIIEEGRRGFCHPSMLGYYAGTNAKETRRGMEISYAYLQLGSCIIQRIPPIP